MKERRSGWRKMTERMGNASGHGLAGWLIRKLRGREHRRPQLELLERITLAPRQSLALVEVEGRRILIATSPEGGPAFFPLAGGARPVTHSNGQRATRLSW
jgi:flagellar biogenesis protein FliO